MQLIPCLSHHSFMGILWFIPFLIPYLPMAPLISPYHIGAWNGASEEHGPSLYQVNRHVVKPVTLAAGGMSYALMRGAQAETNPPTGR